jgi:hypothetical protein
MEPIPTVTITVSKEREGRYRAGVSVSSRTRSAWGTWGHGATGATPMEAVAGAIARIERDLSPKKRGRKATGYRALNLLGGWS